MKALYIALKDTLARFRDRNGLLLMLAAPLVLAAVIGAALGGFSPAAGQAPLRQIPVAIADADQGLQGRAFVNALQSPALTDLLAPRAVSDLAEAKALVAKGEVRAAVYLPAGFSRAVQGPGRVTIELYTDPTAPISAAAVRSVVTQIADRFNSEAIARQMVASDKPTLDQPPALALGRPDISLADSASSADAITLATVIAGNPAQTQASPLAYFTPSMAVLFLMFTLFDAARSLIEEERQGTLARLIASPTRFPTLLAGKIGGVFLTGVAQLGVLILASALLFRLDWGDSPAGLALMVIAVVAAASSLGTLIVALAHDERQAAIIGAAVALIFAILGGNFVQGQSYPAWLQPFSHLTINRWALDGFTDLTIRGLGLANVLLPAGVLLAAAAAFFTLAVWRLPRRFVR